jgi:hypothetical protein
VDHEAEEGAVAVASGVAGAEVEAASDSTSGGDCARAALLHEKGRVAQAESLQRGDVSTVINSTFASSSNARGVADKD